MKLESVFHGNHSNMSLSWWKGTGLFRRLYDIATTLLKQAIFVFAGVFYYLLGNIHHISYCSTIQSLQLISITKTQDMKRQNWQNVVTIHSGVQWTCLGVKSTKFLIFWVLAWILVDTRCFWQFTWYTLQNYDFAAMLTDFFFPPTFM